MIVAAVLAFAWIVLSLVVNAFSGMPTLPTNPLTVLGEALPYVTAGIKFLNVFTHADIVLAMALICVALNDIFRGYRLIMWVAQKIPFFGVSDD